MNEIPESKRKLKVNIGYFQCPNKIFDIEFSIYEKIVYMYLCRCGNNSTAFPSYQTIADKCGMSRKKAIDVIKTLISTGVVYKHERKKKNKNENDSNIYEVLTDLSKFGSVPDTLGSVPDTLGGSVPDTLGGSVPDTLGGSVPDTLGSVPDTLGGSVPDTLGSVPSTPYKELNINNYISYKELNKKCSKEQDLYLNHFFEEIFKLYPREARKGKANVKKAKRKELYRLGYETIKTAIERYLEYVDIKRISFPQLSYKNASTFFNSGYVDYVGDDFEQIKSKPQYQENQKPVQSTNYEQREYDDEFFNSLYANIKVNEKGEFEAK
jgi:hypothetical protein